MNETDPEGRAEDNQTSFISWDTQDFNVNHEHTNSALNLHKCDKIRKWLETARPTFQTERCCKSEQGSF